MQDQVRQCSTGQIRGRDAVADVAAGPCMTAGLVETDRAEPVAWCPDRATPSMRDAGVTEGGEHLAEQGAQRILHPGVPVELRPDRRGEVVRRAASTEGDPIVGRPLPIDDQPTVIVEGLAS